MATSVTVAELLVDLGVGKNDAEKAAGGLDKKLKTATKSAKLLGAGLKTVAKGFAVFATAAAGAAFGVFKFVENVALTGDEIIKTSKKIGSGVEELQRLRFAADRSGADVAKMDLAIKNVAKNMEDARNNGALPFRQALEQLGLSLQSIEGTTVEEKIGIFADAMRDVEDVGQRTALAMNLFGARAGPELVPLLLEGSEGIKALGDRAEELGLVMGADAAKQSEVFVDAMTDLKAIITGVRNEIGVELIPVVQGAVQEFTAWVQANKPLLRQKVTEFFERIVDVGKKLVPILETIGKAIVFLVDNFQILAGIFVGAKIASGFAAVSAGLTAMGVASTAALGPVGLILGALIAITPAAIAAGNALGDFLAGEDLTSRQKKRGKAPATGKSSALARRVSFESRTIDKADAEIARLQGLGLRGNSPALKRQIDFRDAAKARRGKFAKQLTAERTAQSEEDARFAADRPALGPELPPGFDETPKVKKAKAAKTAKPEKAKPLSISTISDLVAAAAGGDLGALASSTPSVAEIEPTIAVDITNNTFNFKNEQTIEGGSSPMETAKATVREIERVFDDRLAEAGQTLAKNVVI